MKFNCLIPVSFQYTNWCGREDIIVISHAEVHAAASPHSLARGRWARTNNGTGCWDACGRKQESRNQLCLALHSVYMAWSFSLCHSIHLHHQQEPLTQEEESLQKNVKTQVGKRSAFVHDQYLFEKPTTDVDGIGSKAGDALRNNANYTHARQLLGEYLFRFGLNDVPGQTFREWLRSIVPPTVMSDFELQNCEVCLKEWTECHLGAAKR